MSSRRGYVINPYTDVFIKIGGPTYERLIRQGVIRPKRPKRPKRSPRKRVSSRKTPRRRVSGGRSARTGRKRASRSVRSSGRRQGRKRSSKTKTPKRRRRTPTYYPGSPTIQRALAREKSWRNLTRKSPTRSATASPIGLILPGKDGRTYRVTYRRNGTKYWKPLKL